jgi:hypothetical protein
MSLILNGDTGVSMVQSGVVEDADLNLSVKPMFSAYQNGSTSCLNAVVTKIVFNIKEFDTTNSYDATTNYRFTPQKAGYYQVSGAITFPALTGNSQATIYKNGVQHKAIALYCNGVSHTPLVSCIIYLNGTTDYIEFYGYQTSGSTLSTVSGRPDITYFQAHYIGA